MGVRLLTYNVGMLPIGGLGDNERRARLLAPHIAAGDFDVVLLNEAFDATGRRALWRELGAAFEHQGGTPGLEAVPEAGEATAQEAPRLVPVDEIDLPDLGKSGLMLLTRHGRVRVREQPTFRKFAAAGHADDLTAKGVAHLKLAIDGNVLHVFATHLQAHEPYQLYRRRQLAEIVDFMRENLPTTVPQPWIFAGDLNVLGGSSEYAEMMTALSVVQGHGAQDLWAALCPGEPGFTWDRANSNVEADEPDARLDYVIASGAGRLVPRSIALQRYRAPDAAGHDLSDHFGLAASFELAGEPA